MRRHGGDPNIRVLGIRLDMARRQVEVIFQDNGVFGYNARIQYAYIPDNTVIGQLLARLWLSSQDRPALREP